MARRSSEIASIRRQRQRQEDELALANMKESTPMRSRRRRRGGQGQHHAERHDREHGAQRPAVDRPPPVADHAAVVARNLDHAASPTRCGARQRARHLTERIAALLEVAQLVERGAGRRQQHHRAGALASAWASACAASSADCRSPQRSNGSLPSSCAANCSVASPIRKAWRMRSNQGSSDADAALLRLAAERSSRCSGSTTAPAPWRRRWSPCCR